MAEILLFVIAAILFITTGIGYVLFNYVILGLLEVMAGLFGTLIGFVVLGLMISWVLEKFNRHS